ncbi:MAG: GTPase Era [Clostridiales bacterium]|nr:GTPase Era [Clostridiales bacterium]
MEKKSFKSGFVTIIGRPNVGKSTLMNAIVGEKVAIVSQKAQTTRNRIMGVYTQEDWQAVFLDTPGIHTPRTKLGDTMMKAVDMALDDTEMIVFVFDASDIRDKDYEIADKYIKSKCPKIAILNKIDLISKDALVALITKLADYKFDDIIPISALKGDGIEIVKKCIKKYLPEGPRYFPNDYITDQPERFLIAEIIREKALRNLTDEIPHGIGVEIMSISTAKSGVLHVEATVYCEKESHKSIIIGKHGTMIGRIGSHAREDIERLMDTRVNLKLWVKVVPDWRNRIGDLKTLGYVE